MFSGFAPKKLQNFVLSKKSEDFRFWSDLCFFFQAVTHLDLGQILRNQIDLESYKQPHKKNIFLHSKSKKNVKKRKINGIICENNSEIWREIWVSYVENLTWLKYKKIIKNVNKQIFAIFCFGPSSCYTCNYNRNIDKVFIC